ncbi:MAG TPA: hypothetical protein VGQ76_21700 [Thermoanaerobaculia bacterium]|jgi:hypothetical protein|nr:hypothetical protein [Thermoanaerobaculia bacterium]
MLSDAERRALETERNALHARIADWSKHIDRAAAPTSAEILIPPLAGCGIALPLFAAFAIFATRNVADGAPQNLPQLVLIGCVTIFFFVTIVVYSYRRRIRASRTAEATRTREMALGPLRERLLEIDKMLKKE